MALCRIRIEGEDVGMKMKYNRTGEYTCDSVMKLFVFGGFLQSGT